MPPKKSSLGRRTKNANAIRRYRDENVSMDEVQRERCRLSMQVIREDDTCQQEEQIQSTQHPRDSRNNKFPRYEIDTRNCRSESSLVDNRRQLQEHLDQGDFSFNTFDNNSLIRAGRIMHEKLNKIKWEKCSFCQKNYICLDLTPRSNKCTYCKGGRKIFSIENDLLPTEAPDCLKRLTPIEKSAICRITPVIQIYKMVSKSTKCRGHCLSLYQDVQDLATQLPRCPSDLPILVMKKRGEMIEDKRFRVNRKHLLDALIYLKGINPFYKDIEISTQNASLYPSHGILQDVPQQEADMPDEEVTAANEEFTEEPSSTVDMPIPGFTVRENLERSVVQSIPEERSELPFPTRGRVPASEFQPGYYTQCFPDLFPDGKGDITNPRIGKNPPLKDYFQHLLQTRRDFAKHHCFCFVVTNILRRHTALTLGNVFASRCADDLSLVDIKNAVAENDYRILNKLLYFSSTLPGTRQHLRFMRDKAISLVRYLRITSDDTEMFSFFQTFSAADHHWPDLHRLLPGSENYLGKRIVDNMDDVTPEEHANCIEKGKDFLLRSKAIRENADLVDAYFYHRLHAMLEDVLSIHGSTAYIVRFEFQARGSIHAHLLLKMKGGPSYLKMKLAQMQLEKATLMEKSQILSARQDIIIHSTLELGISAIHPNSIPSHWPGPYGSNVHTPPLNVLRQNYLDLKDGFEFKERHEMLVNRTMLHKCRIGYCQKQNKRDKDGNLICRFGFPKKLCGFENQYSVSDNGALYLENINRTEEAKGGATYVGDQLTFLRNHPTVVNHVPELLNIWGANIDSNEINSYEQIINYLMKYMFKNEPNSPGFNSISGAVVSNAPIGESLKKVLQKVLMQSIKEHDISKQECMHILNQLPFVEFSHEFVHVNVMGTRRINFSSDNTTLSHPAQEDNYASIYWKRNEDPFFQEAVQKYNSKEPHVIMENPIDINLYNFCRFYTKKWKLSQKEKVPHITPNFYRIPKKNGPNSAQYMLFLKSILLIFKSGTKFNEIDILSREELEDEVDHFVRTESCPELILEEFLESQECKDNNASRDDDDDDDENHVTLSYNLSSNNTDCLIQADNPPEEYPEDNFMVALGPVDQDEVNEFPGEIDYNDISIQNLADTFDWNEDKIKLELTDNDIENLKYWLPNTKEIHENLLTRTGEQMNHEYEQLNIKQQMAFDVVKKFILSVRQNGIEATPQLLLNISGAAGTGKSFLLRAIKMFANEQMGHDNFILTAAPSGTAAFLIGGSTLHSLLLLPVGNPILEPLSPGNLVLLQEKFKNLGILCIDEKSMIGQLTFSMVNQRLQEIKPHGADKPFGGISIVLLGDWKQLPPVCDSSLYAKNTKNPSGRNLYELFSDTIILDKIQRQEGDDQKLFREELKRLGDGEFTIQDWKKWQSRTLDLLPPDEKQDFIDNGILACARKKDMVNHNIEKVQSIGQPVAPIFAQNTGEGGRESADRDSGLIGKIILCRKCIFRLTYNLWTSAGLTNGAIGVVHSIIYKTGVRPPSLPHAIIATFDDYIGPAWREDIPKSVVIVPQKKHWINHNKKNCTRTMLPLILGYALSIHKLQGSTCNRVILNPGDREFALGILLVGATRTKCFEGLAFKPFPNFARFKQLSNSKALSARQAEEKRMKDLEMWTISKYQL